MDFKKLTRDPAFIVSNLKEVGNQRITTKDLKIYFPSRFAERSLAEIGHDNYVIGYIALVMGDKFCTLNIPAMIQFNPTIVNEIEINDTDYYEFIFNAGDVVILNTDIVQRDTLIYYILAETFSKGNIPEYLGFYELAAIFDNAEKYAGTSVVSQRKVIELWLSILARNPDKLIQYYGETIQSEKDIVTRPPVIVGMREVSLIASGTLNRVAGSYMYDGIISSILNPSTEVGLLEQVVRQ